QVKEKKDQENDHIIKNQWSSWLFFFLHYISSFFSPFSVFIFPGSFCTERAVSADISACCMVSVAKSMAYTAYRSSASLWSSSRLLSSEWTSSGICLNNPRVFLLYSSWARASFSTARDRQDLIFFSRSSVFSLYSCSAFSSSLLIASL